MQQEDAAQGTAGVQLEPAGEPGDRKGRSGDDQPERDGLPNRDLAPSHGLRGSSCVEQGELSPQYAPVPIRKFLAGVLDDTRGAAAHLGVKLRESIPTDLPLDLYADAELLHRVLSNLMHNALKYTSSGGIVSLDVDFNDSCFRFSVADTGIGISPENIERLFKKYYRVEGPDQRTRRGSGLGLYFCRLAVEAHGGSITVGSEVNGGTTISFDIPRTPERSPNHVPSR